MFNVTRRALLTSPANIHRSTPIFKKDIATCGLVFLISLLIALSAFRTDIALNPAGYEYGYAALLIKAGHGLGEHYEWPPGYPLAMVLFMEAGISSIRSAWLVSLLSFAGSTTILFFLTRKWTTTTGGMIAAVIFGCNPYILLTANSAGSEMLFVFLALLACVVFDHTFFSATPKHKQSIPLGITSGILLALAFHVRYLGIVVPALAFSLLLFLFWEENDQRAMSAAAAVSMLLTCSLVPLRNYLFTKSLTGRTVSGAAGDPFLTTVVHSLYQLGGGKLWQKLGYSSTLPEIPVAIFVGILLMFLASVAFRNKRYWIVAFFPIAYTLCLSWVGSHSRIDAINPRYVFPAVPFLIISLVQTWHDQSLLRMDWSSMKRIFGTLIAVLTAASAIAGVTLAIRGYAPYDFSWNYSPETIDYIINNLPKGSTIAGNRFGNQLLSTTLDYQYVEIPFDDPLNHGYEHPYAVATQLFSLQELNRGYIHAYGTRLLTRKDAIGLFLKHNVRYVVFYLGKKHDDLYLDNGWYGEYIGSLFSRALPEIEARSDLKDGVIFSVARREKLLEISKQIE
jgi:hypothetical protein